MTFEELLKMPKGMDIEEYNKLLKKQKRIKNRLTRVRNLTQIHIMVDMLKIRTGNDYVITESGLKERN